MEVDKILQSLENSIRESEGDYVTKEGIANFIKNTFNPLIKSKIQDLEEENKELNKDFKTLTELNDCLERISSLSNALKQIKEKENTQLKERVIKLEDLCAEAMGEQEKDWRDRFKQLLNQQQK